MRMAEALDRVTIQRVRMIARKRGTKPTMVSARTPPHPQVPIQSNTTTSFAFPPPSRKTLSWSENSEPDTVMVTPDCTAGMQVGYHASIARPRMGPSTDHSPTIRVLQEFQYIVGLVDGLLVPIESWCPAQLMPPVLLILGGREIHSMSYSEHIPSCQWKS